MHERHSSGSDSAHHHPSETAAGPRLGAGLLLHPRAYERHFWTSAPFLATARVLDLWSLVILLCTNALYLKREWWSKDAYAYLRYAQSAVLFGTTLAQLLWLTRNKATYLRHRSRTLIFNRLLRIATLALLALICRRIISLDPPSHALLRQTFGGLAPPPPPPAAPPHPPNPLYTLKCLMHMTGSGLVLFHSILTPLPFLTALPLQLASFLLLTTFQHAPAVHVSQHLLPPAAAPDVCSSFNVALDLAFVALLGTPPGGALMRRMCDHRPLDALALFLNLYCGLVLPLYISYRMEQQQKQQYVLRVRDALDPEFEGGPPQGVLLSALRDAVVAGALMMQSWVLALTLTPYLQHVAMPL